MSNINDRATVDLFVNGENAEQSMDRLRKKADDLRKAIADAHSAGNGKEAKKLQRELDKTEKEIDRVESAAKGVGIALNNLSDTSIHGLKNSLKQLQRELKFAKPDSEAWNRYAEQIRQVKGRIAELNAELEGSRSAWSRFKEWSTSAWPAIDLLRQGYEAVVNGLREYVNAYAEMDQEMANVRKFTGMTEEQVEALNKGLKKIDTRSSRLELNKLAQEAGRLGKTSQEDVLGFVRAADKINVALDDLGEGATLTLSKLTGIFGDEQRYGTEQSLLKVGSVINELSQNCSASAPYLANFTERMGGVGAQASMTIPQIMGFAAVLDTNSQKVEASATALSQIIVRLYQDPAKYAKVAGLDVQKFATLMREDANSALLLFLETLQKAGGMDQLSPMFKDMGENGSRAIAALSTLATHINMVKAQQAAANDAFREGTSIDKEFAVQNNTVEAALEKRKNIANELRIELGTHLYPIMSHFITADAAIRRILIVVIRYITENKGVVISLTAAIVAYTVAVNFAIIKQKLWMALCAAGRAAVLLWAAAVKLGAVAVALLSGNIAKAKTAWIAFSAVMKANPLGLAIAAVTLLVGLLATFISRASKSTTEAERLAKAQKKIADAEKEAEANCVQELLTLKALYDATQDQNLEMDARLRAVAQLQQQYPEYFANLTTEAILAGQAADAYERLRANIIRSAQAQARKDLLAETESEILKTERERDRKVNETLSEVTVPNNKQLSTPIYEGEYGLQRGYVETDPSQMIRKGYIHQVEADADQKLQQLRKERDMLYSSVTNDVLSDVVQPSYTPSGGTGPESNKDKFAEEKAWRERQEAEARIAYANGQRSFAEHKARMNEIEVEYNQKLLDREDVVGDERLSIQADYWEAVNKKTVDANQALIDAEKSSYESTIYQLNESYRQRLSVGNLSAKERETAEKIHQETIELAELNHLARLVEMHEKGSAERLKAEQAYQTAQINAQKRHQAEYEKHEAEYAKIKDKFFGDNPEDRQGKYDAAISALQGVYDRELLAAGDNAAEKLRIEEAFQQAKLALQQKYGLVAEEDNKNTMQRGVEASIEWLNGEGGKALTGTLSTLTQGMSSIFSGLSTMIQAELDIQTAQIEKRYDKEIQAAQGNSYKVAKLEKKKEKDIAKAKNEANKKMFAMQVIQAVAQTAQNAISAYGSAAAIPVVGTALAPIAAAMAVAAGAIQIAAIKKQQQAAAAKGYSQGGFTGSGGVNEPAGIVHRGEWVASQKLLANPVARPMIDALDYAQRTNTIGSLRADDVSRSITANNSLVRMIESDDRTLVLVAEAARMSDAVNRLNERLDEPFVTVNTVTGDKGIKSAQDEYSRLMRNKTPKSKRNGSDN